MKKYLEMSGRNEEDAIAQALEKLGLERDDVSVEIIERAKSGFLGLRSTPAIIRVEYEAPDEPEAPVAAAPASKPAAAKPAPAAPAAVTKAPAAATAPAVDDDEFKADVRRFVSGLLEHMNVPAEIEISDREKGGVLVNLGGESMGVVIGRRGETLDAIQHLTNYVVNKGSEKRRHISVDAESYRAKREDSLVHLAEKMAAKVVKYKRSMALEPMNSYERHVIHSALQDYEGVSTASTGSEPNRRVVVSYDRPKQTSNKPESREWS